MSLFVDNTDDSDLLDQELMMAAQGPSSSSSSSRRRLQTSTRNRDREDRGNRGEPNTNAFRSNSSRRIMEEQQQQQQQQQQQPYHDQRTSSRDPPARNRGRSSPRTSNNGDQYQPNTVSPPPPDSDPPVRPGVQAVSNEEEDPRMAAEAAKMAQYESTNRTCRPRRQLKKVQPGAVPSNEVSEEEAAKMALFDYDRAQNHHRREREQRRQQREERRKRQLEKQEKLHLQPKDALYYQGDKEGYPDFNNNSFSSSCSLENDPDNWSQGSYSNDHEFDAMKNNISGHTNSTQSFSPSTSSNLDDFRPQESHAAVTPPPHQHHNQDQHYQQYQQQQQPSPPPYHHPNHHGPPEQQRQQHYYNQGRAASPPAHAAYDDYDLQPPPSNHQHQHQQQHPHRKQSPPASVGGGSFGQPVKYIEVSPGLQLRLRGADETRDCIARDFFSPCLCLHCNAELFCISDAAYIICPLCRELTPLSLEDIDNHEGGVGLGFNMQDLERMQWDAIAEQKQRQQKEEEQQQQQQGLGGSSHHSNSSGGGGRHRRRRHQEDQHYGREQQQHERHQYREDDVAPRRRERRSAPRRTGSGRGDDLF
mmetsp:Transcript_8526/g.18400  ORF Transcript_8526/g.18400 Transcript_8526/m.18400 type:complete len:588 (-) Transcript_8526:237-2000(-)